ncbi:MAG: 1-(5-phosphoribosyl)-5-[(5-phosphoribosylamino)methylideneamino]imidazole-4-carboxamide isomerase [Fimbriimonadaceae bacterium]|jgi:phosphoribosylformimino-5-aminoimidazole carboxamide ribotide isomerase|nr:1-(5-phosphoribosyl)-5-[(5-phosphoribosylamino)methylideneamino]imidazole-4-carboxamide isomerase [Fimbriimonadaceae bacterium]
MFLIPAIDIIDGACVRLTEGDYSRKTVYEKDPISVAQSFVDAGAEWIHIIDLDGAKAGDVVNLKLLEKLCRAVPAKIEFGGGIREENLERVLETGVGRAILGTRLVKNLEWAAESFAQYGERLVAAIDTRDGKVSVSGWSDDTEWDGLAFAQKVASLGAPRVIFTDIATDGKLQGPNYAATRRMVEGLEIPVVASGGVSALSDLPALAEIGCEAVIVGKAIYEGRFDVREAITLLQRI